MNDHLDQLDLLARRASTDLEATTEVDPGAGLGRVYTAHTRHRSHARVAVAAVAVVALSAGWFGRGVVTGDRVEPAGRPSPGPTTGSTTAPLHVAQLPPCERSGIDCLGHRTYRFALTSPVRWHIPARFGVASSGPSALGVESYWSHQRNLAGVTIAETFGPLRPDGEPATGLPANPSPRAFAAWLSARPLLDATAPEPTTIGGRSGWRVRARLTPQAGTGSATCDGSIPCFAVGSSDVGYPVGMWEDMVADYTFVSLPSGTALVWSWAFGDDTAALALNQHSIDGISWPAH